MHKESRKRTVLAEKKTAVIEGLYYNGRKNDKRIVEDI